MSDRTLPGIGLKNKWPVGSSGYNVDLDLDLQMIDILMFASVINATTTVPPASPAQGDRYLVPTGATGVWATEVNSIAVWIDGAWVYYTPTAGWEVYNKATSTALTYNGTAWVAASSSIIVQNGTVANSVGTLVAGSNITLTVAAGVVTIAAAGGGAQPYDIITFSPGVLSNAQKVYRGEMVRPVVLPASLTGSVASVGTAPTAAASLTISNNGGSIGVINFASAATTGTFTFASSVTLAAGNVLQITNQATADVAMADLSITLTGTR